MNGDNWVLHVLLGVAATYLVFLAWFMPTVKRWKDPEQTSEPAPLHYLSGAWRRHYLSLFDGLSPLSAVYLVLGLVHYMVMVPLTCIYWLSAPVLNAVDRMAMAVRRLRIKCGNAGCYRSVDLPVHVCPKCDERHRDLRPGRHGLFQRRCQCESPLPAMLVCGRHSLKSLCPHCDQPLGWTFTQDLHIVLVAGPAAGKTSLLTGLFHALRQLQRDGIVKLQFNSPEHERSFDTSLRAFQQGYVPDKTKATLPASFVIQVVNRAREIINVHVYDVAGEVYQDRESLQSHAYFANADAVLFLVDPFSLREVQQQVGERLDPYKEQVTACDEVPQHVYDRLLTVLRSFKESSSRLVNLPVAVTLTKVDAFSLNLGLPAPRLSDEQPSDSSEVKKWLEERGEGNLVRSLEHDFSHVAFFACSALGHLPEEERKTPFEPVGVLAPLEWLLSQAGYRLKSEERKEAASRPTGGRASSASRGTDLVAGANVYAWVALALSLACWLLPGMTCKLSGAAVAALLSILAFMRSTRVLGQGAWVAGLSLVFALVGTTALGAEEGMAWRTERDTQATLAAARQKSLEDDPFTARTLLAGLLAADPANVTARVELARVESQLVRVLLVRGEAELEAGNYNNADSSFRSAGRLRAGASAEAGMKRTLDARVLSLRRQGSQSLATGNLAEADAYVREALYFEPGNEAAKADLAAVLEAKVAQVISEGEILERDHKFDDARASYQSALGVVENHPAVQQHLVALEETITRTLLGEGNALLARHDFNGAQEKFKKAAEREGGQDPAQDGLKRVKSGRIRAMLDRANVAMNRKEYDAALGKFQTVQGMDPANKEARKGIARARQGMYEAEIKAGYATLSREDFDGAQRHFQKAKTILPKAAAADKGLAQTKSKRLYHEGYVDGKKVGREIALQSQRPSSRENLAGAIRATEWRVQQQREGTKDEPASYREGWKTGVDNAIRAEFISMLPPEPKPEPPPRPELTRGPVSRSAGTAYYVIIFDGTQDQASRAQAKALRAGIPAEMYDSSQLPVDGPSSTLVAVAHVGPEEARALVRKARAAGFHDAYSIAGR